MQPAEHESESTYIQSYRRAIRALVETSSLIGAQNLREYTLRVKCGVNLIPMWN